MDHLIIYYMTILAVSYFKKLYLYEKFISVQVHHNFTINYGVLKSHIGTTRASYMLHRARKERLLKISVTIDSSRAKAK